MSRLRAPLALLLGCALLLRALIPAGWMPSAGGGFRIELCATGADAGVTARLQQNARRMLDEALTGTSRHPAKSDRGDGAHDSQPCAFSGLAMAFAAPDAVELPPPPFIPAAVRAPALVAAVGRGLAAPPPPQTGPPALS